MINLISIQIVIVFFEILYRAVMLVKIFSLKFFEVNLNIVLKTIILNIYSYVLVKLLYYILVENIMISYFNVYTIVKEDF